MNTMLFQWIVIITYLSIINSSKNDPLTIVLSGSHLVDLSRDEPENTFQYDNINDITEENSDANASTVSDIKMISTQIINATTESSNTLSDDNNETLIFTNLSPKENISTDLLFSSTLSSQPALSSSSVKPSILSTLFSSLTTLSSHSSSSPPLATLSSLSTELSLSKSTFQSLNPSLNISSLQDVRLYQDSGILMSNGGDNDKKTNYIKNNSIKPSEASENSLGSSSLGSSSLKDKNLSTNITILEYCFLDGVVCNQKVNCTGSGSIDCTVNNDICILSDNISCNPQLTTNICKGKGKCIKSSLASSQSSSTTSTKSSRRLSFASIIIISVVSAFIAVGIVIGVVALYFSWAKLKVRPEHGTA